MNTGQHGLLANWLAAQLTAVSVTAFLSSGKMSQALQYMLNCSMSTCTGLTQAGLLMETILIQ
jgi:hypothetical protein